MPPPRQLTDASARLAELEKDNSYMDTAHHSHAMAIGGGVGVGGAASSAASGGDGRRGGVPAAQQRVHIGRAAAQHDKLVGDSLKIYRKISEKERKKASKLSSVSSGSGARGKTASKRQREEPMKEDPAASALVSSLPPPPRGIVAEDGVLMTAALSAWLRGTYPQPSTVTGLPIGPSLAYLAAPSPSMLAASLGSVVAGSSVASPPLLCSICQLPSRYKCPKCRAARFCSIECGDIHEDMRCNKFVA